VSPLNLKRLVEGQISAFERKLKREEILSDSSEEASGNQKKGTDFVSKTGALY